MTDIDDLQGLDPELTARTGLRARDRRALTALTLVLGAGMALTPSFSGHASTAGTLALVSDIAHVIAAALWHLAGVELVHVPYRGAQAAYQDLLGDRVDLFFDLAPTASRQIAGGRAKPLATSGGARNPEGAASTGHPR